MTFSITAFPLFSSLLNSALVVAMVPSTAVKTPAQVEDVTVALHIPRSKKILFVKTMYESVK